MENKKDKQKKFQVWVYNGYWELALEEDSFSKCVDFVLKDSNANSNKARITQLVDEVMYYSNNEA